VCVRVCVCATLVTLKLKYANISGYWFQFQRLLHAEVIIENLIMWESVVMLSSALRTVYVTYFINKKFSRNIVGQIFHSAKFSFRQSCDKGQMTDTLLCNVL
jgi:hypothetical protein